VINLSGLGSTSERSERPIRSLGPTATASHTRSTTERGRTPRSWHARSRAPRRTSGVCLRFSLTRAKRTHLGPPARPRGRDADRPAPRQLGLGSGGRERPRQSGCRLLGHRTRANGVGVSSAALQEDASKRAAPQRSRPRPRDRASPAALIGVIGFDGKHSCDTAGGRDLLATEAIARPGRATTSSDARRLVPAHNGGGRGASIGWWPLRGYTGRVARRHEVAARRGRFPLTSEWDPVERRSNAAAGWSTLHGR
jgi:hypothetical protein